MIKKIVHSLHILGYRRWQKFFERLYSFSLVGMNIGRAAKVEDDGELRVIQYICNTEHTDNLVVFDVGANIGSYTKALEGQFKERATIYSFEPSQKTFQTLSKNINSDSKYADNIKLYNLGLGNAEGKITLFSDADNSGLASVYKRRLDHSGISMNQSESVMITTLDNFCAKNNIKTIDFLKMDVEGHELSVLDGAKKLLDADAIKYIQFEFGGNNIDSRTFFQDFYYLLSPKFNLFRIVKDGLYPITEYKETYECFMCSNFFAERK